MDILVCDGTVWICLECDFRGDAGEPWPDEVPESVQVKRRKLTFDAEQARKLESTPGRTGDLTMTTGLWKEAARPSSSRPRATEAARDAHCEAQARISAYELERSVKCAAGYKSEDASSVSTWHYRYT